MKSILMSIKPKWVAKILNGEKTIEVRTTAPKDWLDYLSGKTKVKPEPSIVYIYCTNGEDLLCQIDHEWGTIKVIRGAKLKSKFNGKVIAKYMLMEVEVFSVQTPYDGRERKILNEANLMIGEARTYAGGTHPYYNPLYAYHISDLEIFDKPKELGEFTALGKVRDSDCESCEWKEVCKNSFFAECDGKAYHILKRPPMSWCYVEESI